jgi:hypothetical protein
MDGPPICHAFIMVEKSFYIHAILFYLASGRREPVGEALPPHHLPANILGFFGGNQKTQFFASFATNGNTARVKIAPISS